MVVVRLMPDTAATPFLFWTPTRADFQGETWFLNPLCNKEPIKTFSTTSERVVVQCLTQSCVYKPSSVMEGRASPAQGKTLYKVTAGAGGTAAFPEEPRKLISKLNKTTTHKLFNRIQTNSTLVYCVKDN